MAGILYVVATPIGNLEDVTLRALRILREVSLIAAEDTRRTARLLQHYSISTRTTSLHEHNEHDKAQKIIDRLKAGDSVALVSDAGTPLVSDPGRQLVQLAREQQIRVEAIPGPSAVMAALSASGLGAEGFTFLGFPPSRLNDRTKWFDELANIGLLTILFESPHRLLRTLDDLEKVFGPLHEVGVGRELTKVHEELVVQPIFRLRELFATPRGEFTLLVPPKVGNADQRSRPSDAELRIEFDRLTNYGRVKPREALKVLAARHGLSVNALYRLVGRQRLDGQKT